MSIKDKFKQKKSKLLKSHSLETVGKPAESHRYIEQFIDDKERFVPQVDYSDPANFARFGLAEKYYEDSIKRIYMTYPYDGSFYERTAWMNSSSYFDLYVFDQLYPRTNGHALFSPGAPADHAGGGNKGETVHNKEYKYGIPTTKEYILIKGGPSADPDDSDIKKIFPNIAAKTKDNRAANVYDVSENQESNLKIGGVDGNTIEFWLKKDAWTYNATTNAQNEVLFDLYNINAHSSSHAYSRLRVELDGKPSVNSPIRVTYMSGANGCFQVPLGHGSGSTSGSVYVTKATVADGNWHHYAIVLQNSGSNLLDPRKTSSAYAERHSNGTPIEDQNDYKSLRLDLYVDGYHNSTVFTGSSVDYVSASLHATIGALATAPSSSEGLFDGTTMLGAGKLSASMDDFRFWKKARTAEEIGNFWNRDAAGGTNVDTANTDLGVYYKFNEGITGETATDSVVLDYSGRISNGTWTGYSSNSRSTKSAIVQSSASATEFKDPIIYSSHTDVDTLLTNKKNKGRIHDFENPAAIYYKLPEWITSEDSSSGGELKNLTQIIASYFDTLAMQIKSIAEIRNITYPSGSHKPKPFVDNLLESQGFVTSEIFSDATIAEEFLQIGDKKVYQEKLNNIKNLIYRNIYNNLTFIQKSKGTEKSFRNFIRCFGVDDDHIRLNLYANNSTFELKDDFRYVAKKKKYVDFDDSTRNSAVVFQMTGAAAATRSYLKGLPSHDGLGMTFECEAIFPKKRALQSRGYYPFADLTASVFGIHTPLEDQAGDAHTQFADTDSANFQVLVYKEKADSPHVKFALTSSANTLNFTSDNAVASHINTIKNYGLTSSQFYDVYTNQKWNFAVRIRPKNHQWSPKVSGSSHATLAAINRFYEIDFYGVSYVGDTPRDSFHLTASVAGDKGDLFMAAPKRLYVGAHRTNFTGAIQQRADMKIASPKVWMTYLTNEEVKAHARDTDNYGVDHPYRNAYFMEGTGSRPIPKIETLALHWDFSTLSSSDASGEFTVPDISSGSSDLTARYGDLSQIINNQHAGLGYGFVASATGSFDTEYVSSAKLQAPEVANSSEMIEIKSRDDMRFVRDQRPINYYYALEKSPYQAISDEMLNFFATIVDFNNLIGEPVNRYRDSYKQMEKIRSLFFEKVRNDVDVERYINFYRWLDSSIGEMAEQLYPASAQHSKGLRTVIESHVLERNKYRSKFPTIEERHPLKTDVPGSGAPQAPALIPIREVDLGAVQIYNSGLALLSLGTLSIAPEASSPLPQDKNYGFWANFKDDFYDIPSDANEARKKISHVVATADRQVNPASSASPYGRAKQSLNRGPQNLKAESVRSKSYSFSGEILDSYSLGSQAAIVGVPFVNSMEVDSSNQVQDKIVLVAGSIVMRPPDYITAKRTENGSENAFDDGIRPKAKMRPETSRKSLGELGAYRETKLWTEGMFSIYTSSLGLQFTNMHQDLGRTAYNLEAKLQSPFTKKHVGTMPHRNVAINIGTSGSLDSIYDRPEAFRISGPASDLENGSDINVYPPEAKLDGTLDLKNKRSVFQRVEPKRSVNIRNIQNKKKAEVLDPQSREALGNFTRNYEVVQTSGRREQAQWFADNIEASGNVLQNGLEIPVLRDEPTASPSNLGLKDFELLERETKESVFVERFSAPGGYEVMSRGYLDRRGEEVSAYNSLNYRNLFIRNSTGSMRGDDASPINTFSNRTRFSGTVNIDGNDSTKHDGLNALLSRRSGKFGVDSVYGNVRDIDYHTTASYHKVNRNPLRRLKFSGEKDWPEDRDTSRADLAVTGTVYDNYWVSHAIPRSEFQYAWITASAKTNTLPNDQFGHTSTARDYDGFVSTSAGFVPAISFASASDFGTYYHNASYPLTWGVPESDNETDFYQTDFVGINYHVQEPVSSSTNILGYPSDVDLYVHDDTSVSYENLAFGDMQAKSRTLSLEEAQKHTQAHIFNALILHRNGPYQYPSWKQIRTGEHPIARHKRKRNLIDVNTVKQIKNAIDPPGERFYEQPYVDVTSMHGGVQNTTAIGTSTVVSYGGTVIGSGLYTNGGPFENSPNSTGMVEYGNTARRSAPKDARVQPIPLFRETIVPHTMSAVTNAYPPILQSISDLDGNMIVLKHAYGNNIEYMPVDELDAKYNRKENYPKQIHDKLVEEIVDKKSMIFNNLKYSETIYPREENQHLAKVRGRLAYSEQTKAELSQFRMGQQRIFWRDNLADRQLNSDYDGGSAAAAINSMGFRQEFRAGVTGSHALSSRPARPDGDQHDEGNNAHFCFPALSMWPLDNAYHSGSRQPAISRDGNVIPTASQNSGELINPVPYISMYSAINGYNHYGSAYSTIKSYFAPTTASQQYMYPHVNFRFTQHTAQFYSVASWQQATENFWRTPEFSGKKPWYDSYDEYAKDIRYMAKDHTVIPEFRISEHMDYYISNGFRFNNRFMTLEGAATTNLQNEGIQIHPLSASADSPGSTEYNEDFFAVYSHSDFMKHFAKISKDYEEVATPSEFTLRCHGIKKLLPYQGFYPVLRCTQLGSLFSQSYAPYISGSNLTHATASAKFFNYEGSDGPQHLMSLLQPFYSPGIMYNTIKSGIAVDYPIVTGAVPPFGTVEIGGATTDKPHLFLSGGIANSSGATTDNKGNNHVFNMRMPFEAIIQPHDYIPVSSSVTQRDLRSGDPDLGLNRMTFVWPFTGSQINPPHIFCDWSGEYDNRYSLAAHNFFAEIPNFFLKQGLFKSFTSAPESKFKTMTSGSTYYMDVELYKTDDFIMFQGVSDVTTNDYSQYSSLDKESNLFGKKVGYETFVSGTLSGKGSPFGPPSQWYLTGALPQDLFKLGAQMADPSFAPFTPPYFYGHAIARLAFTPDRHFDMLEGETRVFTLDEILGGCRIENTSKAGGYADQRYTYFSSSNELLGKSYDNNMPAGLSQMRITSSVSLYGRTRDKAVEYALNGERGTPTKVTDQPSTDYDRWVIGTKFECPILNFSGNEVGNLADNFWFRNPTKDPSNRTAANQSWDTRVNTNFGSDDVASWFSGSVSLKGMWSGYGSVPQGSKEGVFLRIKDSFPEKLQAGSVVTGSLIDICGFRAGIQRMGELAEDYEKEIFEAIVAIPFIQEDDKRKYFTIPREQVDAVARGDSSIYGPGQSVYDMVTRLQKYVMPPHMDFLKNRGIDPFVVYVFEFSHKFKQKELTDIWQNVMPEISEKAEEQEVVVSHQLAPGEFFNGGSPPPNTRWMVFKVKQKANTNYFQQTADSTDDDRFKFQFKVGEAKIAPDYSYNWPYDFFSLVELAKIDAEVDFAPGPAPGTPPGVSEVVDTLVESDGETFVARVARPNRSAPLPPPPKPGKAGRQNPPEPRSERNLGTAVTLDTNQDQTNQRSEPATGNRNNNTPTTNNNRSGATETTNATTQDTRYSAGSVTVGVTGPVQNNPSSGGSNIRKTRK